MINDSPPHTVIHNPHLAYRRDIDGLRALAILAVVIFHAFPSKLHGGFVGVDIFFVISGYLISSIILKAQSGEGFNLLEFYSRRIKRIFPALIVVLVFCLIAGWFVLLANEYKMLGKHIAAGAAYVSNIALKNEAGYFDTASELKPLLHLWSLGIEEQFYLIWPMILILALPRNINPQAIILLLLAISFSLNILYIGQHPVPVFYQLTSRAWELLVGATLSYINLYQRHRFDRIASKLLLRDPHRAGNDLANILAWIGFTLIVLAVFGINKGKVFPGWWALFPTIGSVLLIMAGEQAWFNRRILSSKLAVYIGLTSYPLYLWHWPLLSFARIVENETPSVWIRLGAIALSVLLAWMTYCLVEKRLRFRQHWSVAMGLFIMLAMIGGIGYQVYRQGGFPNQYAQQEEIARNVGALAWDKQGWNRQAVCADQFGQELQQYCNINNLSKPPTVILIGDSNANHFYPGLAKNYAHDNENLLNLGQGGCPPLYDVNVSMSEGDLHCDIITKKIFNLISETPSIKTVILSMMGTGYVTGKRAINNTHDNFVRLNYSKNLASNQPLAILEDALRVTLNRLTTSGKQVVFIISVPMLDFDPARCIDFRPWRITPAKIKTPCATPRKEIDARNEAYRAMVIKVTQEFPQVKVWDTTRELCDDKYCWAMKDGKLLYRDEVHLNETGSYLMGERLPLQSKLGIPIQ